MVNRIAAIEEGTDFMILAPIVEGRKGEHRDRIDGLKQQGFASSRQQRNREP